MMNRPKRRLRIVPHPAAVPAAVVLLICAAPAGAGWLERGIGVAGAGHSLKETLEETTGIFGRAVDAFIEGADEKVSEITEEIAKTPQKLIRRAFPVLEAPHALAEKVKSAKRKIGRFAGGVGERLAGAGTTLAADARAALAIDRDGRDKGWSDASLLEGEPLPVPVDSKFTARGYESPAEALAALRGEAGEQPPASSWDFEQWVVSEQEARPHCYGVVDPDNLPADCFGPARAGALAAPSGADRVEDSPQAGGSDWASGEWAAEDTGWSGWDASDPRYSEEDREAARVGVFAARCWGVDGVSKHGPMGGLYGLMRERMERNECPNEETDPASSLDSGSEYATALAGVLDEDSAVPASSDYLAALSALDAKEAEERERQARLEAEREHRARLEKEERRLDALERQQQAEYQRQAIRNIGESLRGLVEQMNRTYGGGSSTGRTTGTVPFDYNKRPGSTGSRYCPDGKLRSTYGGPGTCGNK